MDRAIGHRRRYEKEELGEKLRHAGFEVEHIGFQNRLSRLAWRINSKLLGRRSLPSGQSRIFDFFVPLIRALEGNEAQSGLSIIAIGRKPQ